MSADLIGWPTRQLDLSQSEGQGAQIRANWPGAGWKSLLIVVGACPMSCASEGEVLKVHGPSLRRRKPCISRMGWRAGGNVVASLIRIGLLRH
jgi:hypothetical protein